MSTEKPKFTEEERLKFYQSVCDALINIVVNTNSSIDSSMDQKISTEKVIYDFLDNPDPKPKAKAGGNIGTCQCHTPDGIIQGLTPAQCKAIGGNPTAGGGPRERG